MAALLLWQGSLGALPNLLVAADRTALVSLYGSLPQAAREKALADPSLFNRTLTAVLAGDPWLHALVDKSHRLPPDYEPDDLVELDEVPGVVVNKPGMQLRREAVDALVAMQEAASAEGITIDVSSAYRSWLYQKQLFARNVARDGFAVASRESAVEGASQHQLGLAVDFGSVTAAFADTPAGRWLFRHAGDYGFSLSYPEGLESLTGYIHEPWHYRYVGREKVRFIDTWFGGVQQDALSWLERNRSHLALFKEGR